MPKFSKIQLVSLCSLGLIEILMYYGETTKDEVYSMFGSPTDYVRTKDGKILLVYEVTKKEESVFGCVPCLNLLYNPVTFNYQTLAFLIGPDGRVEKHILKDNKYKGRADIFGTPW